MAEILMQLKGRLVLLENHSLHCSSESTQARRVSESSRAHREPEVGQSQDDSAEVLGQQRVARAQKRARPPVRAARASHGVGSESASARRRVSLGCQAVGRELPVRAQPSPSAVGCLGRIGSSGSPPAGSAASARVVTGRADGVSPK
jgi:hypothetical protein